MTSKEKLIEILNIMYEVDGNYAYRAKRTITMEKSRGYGALADSDNNVTPRWRFHDMTIIKDLIDLIEAY